MSESEPPRESTEGDGEVRDQPSPRIYVASLSDYNAGLLHGEWVDAAQEPEALHAAITEMLARSPTLGAEEFAIHDYDGFGQLHLGEYESVDTVARIAAGIVEHGPAFAAWVSIVGTSDPEALDRFEDAYLGEWPSVEAYAEELCDMGDFDRLLELVIEVLQPYVNVDFAAFARDMELGGYITVVRWPDGSGVWIFDGRA
jgi:antirestriction protein